MALGIRQFPPAKRNSVDLYKPSNLNDKEIHSFNVSVIWEFWDDKLRYLLVYWLVPSLQVNGASWSKKLITMSKNQGHHVHRFVYKWTQEPIS